MNFDDMTFEQLCSMLASLFYKGDEAGLLAVHAELRTRISETLYSDNSLVDANLPTDR